MATLTDGPDLLPFEMQPDNIPHLKISGPGPNAFEPLAASDERTLISPGVVDCAILAACHAQTGLRLMAHYNPFSGPRAAALKGCFEQIRKSFPPGEMAFTIAYNRNAHRPYVPALFNILQEALPELGEVIRRGFGKLYGEGQRQKAISIYLTPKGEVFASAP